MLVLCVLCDLLFVIFVVNGFVTKKIVIFS
jgi:hypothetical protein